MPHPYNNPNFVAQVEHGIPLKRLEQRLRPWHSIHGKNEAKKHDGWLDYSAIGFLGRNEELLQVIYNDEQTVEHHGTTHTRVADALDELIAGNYQLNPSFEFIKKRTYLALIEEITDLDYGGDQSCPWECFIPSSPSSILFERKYFEENPPKEPLSDSMYNAVPGIFGVIVGTGLPAQPKRGLKEDVERKIEELVEKCRWEEASRQQPSIHELRDGLFARFVDSERRPLSGGALNTALADLEKTRYEQTRPLAVKLRMLAEYYLKRENPVQVPVGLLLPHLIRKHNFYEGQQSMYRADPAVLIQALNLAKMNPH